MERPCKVSSFVLASKSFARRCYIGYTVRDAVKSLSIREYECPQVLDVCVTMSYKIVKGGFTAFVTEGICASRESASFQCQFMEGSLKNMRDCSVRTIS